MLPKKLVFSFKYLVNRCLDDKIKGKYFTNKISKKEKISFFARVFSTLKIYSDYNLIELGQQKICYQIKEEKILWRLSEILQAFGHNEEWITKIFYNYPIYKFKITSGNLRMFGYYSENVFYVLFFDTQHLVEPDDKFGIADNLTCAWCIKNCDE